MSERPNIVLINVDQWRGDCLSVSGHPVVSTPYLDQLSLTGARFDRAYAACPSCIPARVALLTGLTQRTHGRVGYQDGVPWNYPVNIASEFTRQGYHTQAVGKMHVFPERSLMGFHNVVLHDPTRNRVGGRSLDQIDDYLPWARQLMGRDVDYTEHGINNCSYVARPWDKPEHVHSTNFVTTQSIDFLRRRDTTKPFFLYMSYFHPHPPYVPPAWAFEQYIHQTMPDVPIGDWADKFAGIADPFRHDTKAGKIDPRMLHRARAGYYGHMTHIDQQINYFLETLGEHRLRENTYICFVSDHGELIGDHNLFRKIFPYEGSARVPLILNGPAKSGIVKRAVYNQVIELRDIMPTLLDCAGLSIPESVEGRSFLPMARGESREWRTYLHGEHVYNPGPLSTQWLTDGKEKYIWFSEDGSEQFFDLEKDPTELHDLAQLKSHAERMNHWRKILIEELRGREEGFTDGQRLIAGRPQNPVLSHIRPVK